MDSARNEQVAYFLVFVLFFGGVFFLYKSYTSEEQRQEQIPETVQFTPKPKKAVKNSVTTREKKDAKNSNAQSQPSALTTFNTLKKHEMISTVSKRRFNRAAHLQIDWPTDLNYLEVDGEEGIKTIHGYNTATGVNLDALASPKVFNIKDIKKSLERNDIYIPALAKKRLGPIRAATNIKISKSIPGIKKIEFLTSKTRSGEQVYFALLNRKDRKASYLFVYSGPPEALNSSDGYIEQMYQSMKTLPFEKK